MVGCFHALLVLTAIYDRFVAIAEHLGSLFLEEANKQSLNFDQHNHSLRNVSSNVLILLQKV